jgi:hypothetical protein
MAFKITPPYSMDNTPIYSVNMEDGVMGKANNNGSIILNKDLDPSQCEKVIAHEKIHLEQMKRGDLNYDDNYVYWKGKKYSRAQMKEGAKKPALGS